jgi:DHA1 family multidrug resistance protein-like MFS transporter
MKNEPQKEIKLSTDTNRDWVRLLVLFSFAGLVEAFFYGHLSAFSPLYIQSIGVQPSQVAHWTGILASISAIVGLPFLPIWGALADRYSRKPFIIRSFLVHMVVGTVMSLAGNVYIFVFGRGIASLSLGDSSLMMTALVERTPAHRQGLAFSIFNSTAPIGVFLGPLVGGWIIKQWGFPVLLRLDIILLAGVVAALFFGFKEEKHISERKPIFRMVFDALKTIATDRSIVILFSALFMLFSGWMLANTYISLAIGKVYTGMNLSVVVGIILGIGGFVSLCLSPFLGAASDRYGRKRVLLIILFAETILMFIPAFIRNIYIFGAFWAVINGLNSGMFALSFTLVANAAAQKVRARVMSLSYLPVFLGQILGPSIGGIVAKRNPLWMFPTAGGFTLIGAVLLLFTGKRKVHPE